MKIWFTADWHLGETRFEIMGRPFTDQQEMVDRLVWEHNQLVSPEDLVYVIGDVCYQKTPEFLTEVKRFNGNKILIRGNHDRVFSDKDLEPYFDFIVAEGEGINYCAVRYGDKDPTEFYLTHYPTRGVVDKFNLVGHIHGAWKYQLNMLNVGVDVHNYRPVCEDSLEFHFKAINEFYDNDVWIAYNEINKHYLGIRGKQSSYFE